MEQRDKKSIDLWTLAGEISTATDADLFFSRVMLETDLYSNGTRSLLNTGIQCLMEGSKTDVALGGKIINKHFLPLCLEQDTIISPLILDARAAREILSNWIEQYPDESRIPLRTAILRHILDSLEQTASVASISTLAAVGLRSRWTERILIRFVDQEGPLGDAAINALCALRPKSAMRSRLITRVLERDPKGLTTKYDYAIQELSSPKFIASLRDRLSRVGSDVWRAAFLLGCIANNVPGDQAVQKRVFGVFEAALSSNNPIPSVGNTIANCNTARAVSVLLERMEQPGFALHSVATHLKDCVRPEQLKGWSAATKADLKTRLTKYAILSGGETRSMTIEDHLRRSAWETALCAGITDVSNWLVDSGESSPFAIGEIFTYSSFLILREWPRLMIRLVTERVDVQGDNNNWFFARIAAGQAIAATESVEALKILIDCGMTGSGAPLHSTTELVGDLVERLARRNLDEVLAHLLNVCEDQANISRRMSALTGLQRLAAMELLPNEYLDRILSVAEDDSLPEFATAVVIWIAASFQAARSKVGFAQRLVRYLEDSSTPGALKFQSLQALIHLGIWSDRSQTLLQTLGMSSSGSRIGESQLRDYEGWQGYGLGLLVTRNPAIFHDAAKQVLEHGQGQAVHLLLQALDMAAPLREESLIELGRSAISRSRRVLARSFGETDNFPIIARLVPSEFLATDWENLWGDWMPRVRSALADALLEISNSDKRDTDRMLNLLEWLLSDSTYLVRRSAARSYSRIDQPRLEILCRRWMRAGKSDLRIRCAENAQWLPIDNWKHINNSILRDLLQDPEPSVRLAAKRSASELRTREWCASVLAQIKSGDRNDGEQWVSDCYCYGRAIVALGDDETIAALRDIRRDRNTPINVKNWLRHLTEDLEKHWREVTQRWPDSLLAWSGQLEELDTEFMIGDRRFVSNISLWMRRQEEPTGLVSWGGGFVIPSTIERIQMFLAPPSGPVSLSIAGRVPCQIWYSGANEQGQVSFIGTGPYPQPVGPP